MVINSSWRARGNWHSRCAMEWIRGVALVPLRNLTRSGRSIAARVAVPLAVGIVGAAFAQHAYAQSNIATGAGGTVTATGPANTVTITATGGTTVTYLPEHSGTHGL